MHTQDRRRAIERILTTQEVRSQSELAQILEEEGVTTTQPVLSRDLRSLKVAKRDGAYQFLEAERFTPLEALGSFLRGVQLAGPNMVVVHCEPGAASAVARALEAEALGGVAGTVAGDDTIFVAVEDQTAGMLVAETVEATLEEQA